MSKPHRIVVKYNDTAYLVMGDSLKELRSDDQTDWVKRCVERADNWRRGLLVNLQAAIAYADASEMGRDVGLQDDQDSQDNQDDSGE